MNMPKTFAIDKHVQPAELAFVHQVGRSVSFFNIGVFGTERLSRSG